MEYQTEVPTMLLPQYPEPLIVISVSKAGGGTIGKSYTGTWHYRAYIRGCLMISGDDLHTGTPKTHEQAARIVAGFLVSGSYGIPEDQHDRLALFAEGE
jgi:hypothetical protein